MERIRKPFQGVVNIVKFNWHFYMLAGLCVLLAVTLVKQTHPIYFEIVYLLCLLISLAVISSLIVSWYVYDVSDLYKLNWLNVIDLKTGDKIVNVHAGFDETSSLLAVKYPANSLTVLDFYDPVKHTEISIKRARKAYPPFENTKAVVTSYVPLTNNEADLICIILSAHEIRNDAERILFFIELKRVLKAGGRIIVTEHLRDMNNLLAYNIGCLHFLTSAKWYTTFREADLMVVNEIRITPFITTFILAKNGTAS